jgi:hypothetical protein
MIKVRPAALSKDRHFVNLSGRLPSGWVGGFTRGLAEAGISIESGFGSRNARGFWTAEFELRRTRSSLDPARIDYAGLLKAPPARGVLTPIRLYRYSAVRGNGEKRVCLDVEAPDQVGFLAQLLSQLSFFSLFPVELRVETRQGHVHDTVHLASVAGGAPSDHALVALRRDLNGLLLDQTTVLSS